MPNNETSNQLREMADTLHEIRLKLDQLHQDHVQTKTLLMGADGQEGALRRLAAVERAISDLSHQIAKGKGAMIAIASVGGAVGSKLFGVISDVLK